MPLRSRSLVLAIDLGSSSVRAALFTEHGARITSSTSSRRYAVNYTADGGAVLDPQLLLHATRACVTETLAARGKHPIVGVSGSAFWHSLLGLNAAGEPTSSIFTWADSRSAPDAANLRKQLSERRMQLRTGCMLRAPYWPAKLRWLCRADPALVKRTVQWISPAPWIFAKIFGVDHTSHSMASGTGLYNLRARAWDAELCDLCGVRAERFGPLADAMRATNLMPQLKDAIIFPAIGDGAAGNLGSGADVHGRIAINIGTSGAVREIRPIQVRDDQPLPLGLFKYVVDKERVVVGGAISNGGNLHRWSMDVLQIGSEAEAEKALARENAAADSLTVLPFWVSERAPTWPENLRGTIVGLTPVTGAGEILRAVTTSTFYRLADILEQLQANSRALKEVIVSGGILHSPASLAILADALGSDLRLCREPESSLRGAAVHALEHLGLRVAPLRAGRLIRHRPTLAEKHRARRLEQNALERFLSRRTR